MEQSRWNRIEELTQAALDLRSEERTAFLRRVCAEDARLYDDVHALLANESASALLDAPAIASLGFVPLEPSLAGQQISHYRIEERIGGGGMGEVYRARDETLRRTVALKTLPPEFTADADRVRRFEQEAFAASRLNHPNIITIFEILHTGDTHWIATEHVEGETLRAILQDPNTKKSLSVTVDRAVDIAMQITAALEAAHAAGIVHRDVKPENVMVRPDGVVKILDFGIAKLSEEITADPVPRVASEATSTSRDLTVPGAIVGTATYMSPEQARGEPLDARTDLYSLGLVLYEMVAGQRCPPSAVRHLENVPRALQRILEKMLRANRDERYASANELLHDLGELRRRMQTASSRRLVHVSALVALAAFALTAVAAVLSIREQWDERILHDGHTAAVRRAIFSHDGRLVASVGEDDQVMLWDFARRERLATLHARARSMALSPDGRWIATGGVDGTVMIWEMRTRRPIRVLRHDRRHGGTTAVDFSPDSSLLVSATMIERIAWDTAHWNRTHVWPDGGVSYGTYLFPPGSAQMLCPTALTTDLETGATSSEPKSWNWTALSPDLSQVAAIDPQGTVHFQLLTRPGDLGARGPTVSVRAHQDHGRSIAFSPDGRLVASAADDVVLWDAIRHEKIARFEYDSIVWSVAFSPDGRWLISTHGDGAMLVWNVAERRRAASLNAHGAGVRGVAFDSTGGQLASASEDHAVIVWDLRTGRKRHVLTGHATRVTAVSFASPDRLASTDQDSNVIVWDLEARRPARIIPGETHSYTVALSPDGNILATTHGIYATGDGRALVRFSERGWPYNTIYSAAFSHDGRHLATVTDVGWLLLWDVRSMRLVATQRVPNAHLITVGFAPDGGSLVTGEDEGSVRLWSLSPLREIAVLGRHTARVKSVAFAPHGATVASAGDDKMIRLWDVKRRRPRGVVGTHTSPIYSIAFSPDGRQLASGEHDRSVRIYTRRRELWGWPLD